MVVVLVVVLVVVVGMVVVVMAVVVGVVVEVLVISYGFCFFFHQVRSLKALKKILDEQTVTKTVSTMGTEQVREGFEDNWKLKFSDLCTLF